MEIILLGTFSGTFRGHLGDIGDIYRGHVPYIEKGTVCPLKMNVPKKEKKQFLKGRKKEK